MKVIIPLAGRGTRLRPHTYVTPKPLLHVAGRPVMSYILDDLRTFGVDEIIFITGYLKEQIEEYVRREYADFTCHFVEQRVPNGTAGAVGLAEPLVDRDVLIIFVDTLFDADLGEIRTLPDTHAGLIWAKEVEDYQRFGVIVTDDAGDMKRIVEKPRDPVSRLANIGLYYIRDWQLLFAGIRETMSGPRAQGGEYYLTDAFQYMIDRGARIRVSEVEGWYDCGQVETLLDTNRHLLENGRARRPDGGRGVRVVPPVRVEEGVKLENVELGPNVTIESGCTIRNARLRDTLVGGDSVIADAALHESIVGAHAHVSGMRGRISVTDHSELHGGE